MMMTKTVDISSVGTDDNLDRAKVMKDFIVNSDKFIVSMNKGSNSISIALLNLNEMDLLVPKDIEEELSSRLEKVTFDILDVIGFENTYNYNVLNRELVSLVKGDINRLIKKWEMESRRSIEGLILELLEVDYTYDIVKSD